MPVPPAPPPLPSSQQYEQSEADPVRTHSESFDFTTTNKEPPDYPPPPPPTAARPVTDPGYCTCARPSSGMSPRSKSRGEANLPHSSLQEGQMEGTKFNSKNPYCRGYEVKAPDASNLDSWIREPVPHVEINSKVKFFEEKIEKETQDVQRLREAMADLEKHRQETQWKWARVRHQKYLHHDGCGNYPDGRRGVLPLGETCDGKNCPLLNSSSEAEKSENSSERKGSGSKVAISSNKKRKKADSIDESTSTRESLTEVAMNSQALILSKEVFKIPDLESTDELRKVLADAEGKLVFINFYAPWCKPCKTMDPILLELANAHPDVKFFQVDVDKISFEGALDEFNVKYIPSYFYFKGSAEVAKVEGQTKKSILEDWMAQSKSQIFNGN